MLLYNEPMKCRELEMIITQIVQQVHGLSQAAAIDCWPSFRMRLQHWINLSVITGGHSVWAALPPFPAQPAQDPRPITLVTAAIDSTAFFHDLAKVPSCPGRCKLACCMHCPVFAGT